MPTDLSPLWISLKTAGIATGITFFAGIAAAFWMLGYRGKGRSVIEGIFISPLILPPTVVGFLLLLLFGRNGPLGQLLATLHFNLVFTWYAAILTATVVAFPLMYRTALGAFEQIDANIVRVARSLGASEWRIFWQILLPLSVPGILAGATLAFARALGEFGATLMLAGNIPGQTQTIPMAIYFAVEAGSMQEAWLWVMVILGISLSVIFVANLWQDHKTWNRQESQAMLSGDGAIAPSPIIPSHSLESGLVVDIEKQLSGFTLRVAFATQGQTLGMLGASGAGKSMILRCLAGIETPTAGRILLNGRVLFDSKQGINRPSRDRRIGFLVQNYALFPHMTVAQNIAFGLLPQSQPSRSAKALREHIEAQLAAVHLQGLGDRYPHQLSGGQQQRVALARALASQPELLLLDEPFSALDTHLRSQLEQDMVLRLSHYQGVSLLVTHNLEEAYRVCQDLLVMEQGHAIALGSKHQIFEHPGYVSVAQLTGCKNFSQAVAQTPTSIKAVDWGCTLTVDEPIPSNLRQVGIRAHQISFLEYHDGTSSSLRRDRPPEPDNTFPCWIARTSETPHRMTLYLKLNAPPSHPQDYHLQAEVFKEKWSVLKDHPFPWHVRLDPQRLMLLK